VIILIFHPEPAWSNVQVFAIYNDEFFGKDAIFKFIQNNILDELTGLGIIIGASLIAFSREKNEDEFISQLRYESLLWATYVNYAILIFSIIFFYGFAFYWIMVANMFTILLFFIIRFNWQIIKYRNELTNEK
jgi:hypothetical protein